jgi:hypothetical protein
VTSEGKGAFTLLNLVMKGFAVATVASHGSAARCMRLSTVTTASARVPIGVHFSQFVA